MHISKIKTASYLLLSSFFFSNLSYAEQAKKTPYYVRLDAGLSNPKNNLSEEEYFSVKPLRSSFYGIGVGYVFNKNIRSDLIFTDRASYQFSYTGIVNGDQDVTANQKFRSKTLMLNTYYSLPINEIVTPYFNLGIGASKVSTTAYYAKYTSGDDLIYNSAPTHKYNLAWNIGLGSQFKMTDSITFDAFVRYIDLGKTQTQIHNLSDNGKVTGSTVAPFALQSYETGISFIYRF